MKEVTEMKIKNMNMKMLGAAATGIQGAGLLLSILGSVVNGRMQDITIEQKVAEILEKKGL